MRFGVGFANGVVFAIAGFGLIFVGLGLLGVGGVVRTVLAVGVGIALGLFGGVLAYRTWNRS